jgi:hypothetical protein
MGIFKIKWVHLLVVLCLGFLVSCKSEDEVDPNSIPVAIPKDPPGTTDPVQPDPSDPPPAPPVKIKKKVIIGNYFDPDAARPKKDSKGYNQLGHWEQSSLTGFKDSISRYSLEEDASVEYKTNKIGPGKYCVSVYKVAHANSESDTSVEVFEDEVLITSKSVDYRSKGGWEHIGEFDFGSKKEAKVVISRGENSNAGALRADEVRFLKMKDGFDCLGRKYAKIKKNAVIDNKFDPSADKPKKDSPGYRESGVWLKSSLPGFKNSISRYSSDEEAFVTYSGVVSQPNYCVKVFRVTHPNSAKEVRVSVSQGETTIEEVVLDYALTPIEQGWVEIGNLSFDVTKPVVVKVEKISAGSGVLRADAVRFQSKACK